jgi:hypothetical protein
LSESATGIHHAGGKLKTAMKVLVGLYLASMAILEYKYAGPNWLDSVVSSAYQISDACIALNGQTMLIGSVANGWHLDVQE